MKYQPTLEQYEIIYNNTSDAIFLIGVEAEDVYRILSVNSAYLRWNNLQPEDIIGKLATNYYRKLGAEHHLLQHYANAIETRGPYRYEIPVELIGENQHFQTTLVPVFDDDTCTHIIGVVRNITLARQEKQKLQFEKQKAENYLDIAAALIVTLDLDGRITLLNRKGYELLGYEPGSLTGKLWFESTAKAEVKEVREKFFSECIQNKEPIAETKSVLLTCSGEERQIRMLHTLLFDEAGEVIGMLNSGEDVTDIDRAQKSLIISQRLMAAEEVVMATAHDFNNSLQAIMGNLEIALDRANLPEEVAVYLKSSITLAEDAGSRIRSLNHSPDALASKDFNPVDINQLAKDVVDETRFYWDGMNPNGHARVSVDIQLSSGIITSSGSAADLRTVLFNIIKNSVEAIPQEGRVTIKTFRQDNQNIVQVSDNGIGMDADTITRVFQPFFSTKGFASGRGIGMSSARNIVRAHAGDIEVLSSALGIGTSIQISLPVADDSSPTTIEEPKESLAHSILWVDDDERIQDLAKGYIEGLGHRGKVVGSGAEALALIVKGEFSIVITDLGMPEMNGFELAINIQKINQQIPIVALTGWGDAKVNKDQSAVGISEIVGKPMRLETFKAVLDRYSGIPLQE
jgi:PAS domain S-box-containing protein